ncbi:hypothetical protein ACEWY4_012733 [Coilia grayii]|uniref:Uncharacterized protein n=1 Tax=Coilia grayii TaxID=363190 RepID=A0ABD1JUG8_9TELE
MPTADAPGSRFDMQLLGKLTLSVATVLFISWAYRFYSSRGRRQGQAQQNGASVSTPPLPSSPPPPSPSSSPSSLPNHHGSGPAPKRCSSCKMELRPRGKMTPEPTAGDGSPARQVLKISVRSLSAPDEGDAHGGEHPSGVPDFASARQIMSAMFEERSQGGRGERGSAMGEAERKEKSRNLAATLSPPSVAKSGSASPAERLSPCPASPTGRLSPCPVSPTGRLSPCPVSPTGRLSPCPTSPTGRRSPCLLRKLDGAVEVGRELIQDLSHQGNFSSFQSKAEVKVEEADLVLEGPEEKKNAEVRGKIYDYYVESSSHSISEVPSPSSPTSIHFRSVGRLQPHPLTLATQNSASSICNECPRTLSPASPPLIIRDLVLTQGSLDGPQSPISPKESPPGHPLRGPLRKDSYLMAAANSDLQSPCLMVEASDPPRSPSPALLSADVPLPRPVGLKAPDEDAPDPDESSDEPSLETVARAKFVHIPLESLAGSDWESLTGRLNLGNCLEALSLAKKRGHSALQQAALRVMSDNYLQVLRDPGLYGKLRAGDREQIQRLRMKGRQYLMAADMESPDWSRRTPSSAQMNDTKDSPRTSSGLYYYDDYEDTWHHQCNIPSEVISVGSAMCTMDNYLFVAVGCQGSDHTTVPSRRVFCFNPVTAIWSEICSMNEARPHCKLVALQGYIYAIGGECLSTVERYDPRADRWTFVAPLPNDTFAVAHRATACNGELFVSGGTLRYTLLRYNPKSNTWRRSIIVGTRERTAEMVAVRSFLYRFDVNPTFGINVYRYHTVARLWYECCAKRRPHCPAFQCVTMGDVIYCVSRQFTMRFLADEVSPSFVAEDLRVLTTAKGILFPFVLALPDKRTLQTSV